MLMGWIADSKNLAVLRKVFHLEGYIKLIHFNITSQR